MVSGEQQDSAKRVAPSPLFVLRRFLSVQNQRKKHHTLCSEYPLGQ